MNGQRTLCKVTVKLMVAKSREYNPPVSCLTGLLLNSILMREDNEAI